MLKEPATDIKVEELMEKIRADVRSRSEKDVQIKSNLFSCNNSRSAFSPSIDEVHIEAVPAVPPFETRQEGYHIRDFLKYYDENFVMNAYLGILKRQPDEEGLEYFLANIRSGRMTKAEVLGRLRYANEGRGKKVRIKGLFSHFFIQSSFRIPVIGFLFRLVVGILNLPQIIRNLLIFENNVFAKLQTERNCLNNISGTFQDKINKINRKYEELGLGLNEKAFRYELTNLEKKFCESLEKSATKTEVEDINTRIHDILHEVEAKPQHKDLSILDERKANRDELFHLRNEIEGVLKQSADKEKQIETIRVQIHEIFRRTRDHKLNILDQQRRLMLLLEEARKRFPDPISTNQISKMLKEEDHILDAMYVSLEDRFRGTREDIKKRLEIYLPVMSEAKAGTEDSAILDLGCGRGEWLELCAENDLSAVGVDINHQMVGLCLESGLDAIEADVISFVREKKSNTFGAVTGFQIVEHLSMKLLISLIDEALRIIKPGGVVVFETPNPQNLIVGGCNFYTDPFHQNPIPHHTLEFLLEARGFIGIESLMKPMEAVELDSPYLRDFFNTWINVPADYAVIGRKI